MLSCHVRAFIRRGRPLGVREQHRCQKGDMPMALHANSRRAKIGLPPGSLIPIGEKRMDHTILSLLEYTAETVTERALTIDEVCKEPPPSAGVRWLNVIGLHESEVLQRLGDTFGIHALVLEDIMTTGQRPRMEDYGDYLYIVVKMLYHGGAERQIVAEQVSILFGPFGVITFQEIEGDVFNPIRDRVRTAKGRIRSLGPDYLAYRLLDAIIDNYFIVLEDVSDRVEGIQDQVANKPEPGIVHEIHRLKRDIIFLRKALRPVREVVGGLQKSESARLTPSTEIYLRDAYEHAIEVIDTVETMRDTLSSALDIYLSSMSNRMNEIMRVLTVMSTLFIPLTFIVGVYGMNFQHMPELASPFGYIGVWVVMIVVVLVMLAFFRRKKWL